MFWRDVISVRRELRFRDEDVGVGVEGGRVLVKRGEMCRVWVVRILGGG